MSQEWETMERIASRDTQKQVEDGSRSQHQAGGRQDLLDDPLDSTLALGAHGENGIHEL
jgi:hypothetical protein